MANIELKCLKKVNLLHSKFTKEKKSPFIIYAGFESSLEPGNNEEQNPEKPYTNKCQKKIACSYGNKLVWVDDNFNKHFKTCLGIYSVENFINNVIEKSKYCSGVMKKHFNKELVMTKEDNGNFKNYIKCWICDNDNIDDVKVRDHCHKTGK